MHMMMLEPEVPVSNVIDERTKQNAQPPTANSLVAPLHDRMPELLHLTEFDHWLELSLNNPEKIQRYY